RREAGPHDGRTFRSALLLSPCSEPSCLTAFEFDEPRPVNDVRRPHGPVAFGFLRQPRAGLSPGAVSRLLTASHGPAKRTSDEQESVRRQPFLRGDRSATDRG